MNYSYDKYLLNQKSKELEKLTDEKKAYSKPKREQIAYKFSERGKGTLYESIILSTNPYFITYDKEKDIIISIPNIVESTRIIRPPFQEECPFEPYEFEDIDELNSYLERAKNETIDSLYQKIKIKKKNNINKKKKKNFKKKII